MMRTTRQPTIIPAMAPVDSFGLFLVVLLGSLSETFGTDEVMGGLIIDNDGVVGGPETIDGGDMVVEVGSGVVNDSSLVDVTSAGMLIVTGNDEAGMNVVKGEGISGVAVAIGVLPGSWKTVTVSVTGVVNWPSSSNCLSFSPRTAVSSSVLCWTPSLLCNPLLLYFACISRRLWYRANPVA